MDGSNKKAKDQTSESPRSVPGVDEAGPPPDPRGTSLPSGSINSEFDPNVMAIENHEEAFNDDQAGAISPITAAGITRPTPQMQINTNRGRRKNLLKSAKFWLTVVFTMLAVSTALWFIQPTRIYIVNALGLRTHVSISTRTVAEPGLPSAILQKTLVGLNNQQVESDEQGLARFDAAYGQANITAHKSGYESVQQADFYDFDPFFGLFGRIPLERQAELQLKNVGLSLTFTVSDWLTGKPITNGEFKVGDIVSAPNQDGLVSVKVPPTDDVVITVDAKAAGYISKQAELALKEDPLQELVLIPAGRNYFISKTSGQFGVYSSNLDGSDVSTVVAPTANETSAINFSVSPDGKYGVLVSSREGKRDSGGSLLQKLYTINLADGTLLAQDEGSWFDLIDWAGNTLVYTAAAAESGQQRLGSVDASGNKKTNLSTAASYGQIRVVLNQVVYVLNSPVGSSGAENNPELRIVPVTGGVERNIGNKVGSVTQTDHDRVVYRTSDNVWHQFDLNTLTPSSVSAPASQNRLFVNSTSADGQNRLFVDKAGDVDALYVKSVATGTETKLYEGVGLGAPVRWQGNLVVFGLTTPQETAHYVLAPGSEPKKVSGVETSSSPKNANMFNLY